MSLRAVINNHCRQCIYDPKSGLGTWRQQVEGCTITRCSLWPVRPKSAGGGKSAPETELAGDSAQPTGDA